MAVVAAASPRSRYPRRRAHMPCSKSRSRAAATRFPKHPQRVVLRFDEPVEVAFGSVRVYDARGDRVDSGSTQHPGSSGDAVAVDLRRGLGDGVYTVTYRVISADSHPVTGGFTFTVGAGGAAPTSSVADLIDAGRAGPVTEAAFGAVRALCYLAIALAAGGLVFVLAVWRPALSGLAGTSEAWHDARHAFAARARAIGLVAASARRGVLGARARPAGCDRRRDLRVGRLRPERPGRRDRHALRNRLEPPARRLRGFRNAHCAGRAATRSRGSGPLGRPWRARLQPSSASRPPWPDMPPPSIQAPCLCRPTSCT